MLRLSVARLLALLRQGEAKEGGQPLGLGKGVVLVHCWQTGMPPVLNVQALPAEPLPSLHACKPRRSVGVAKLHFDSSVSQQLFRRAE